MAEPPINTTHSTRGWITPLVAGLSDYLHHFIRGSHGPRPEAQENQENPAYTGKRTNEVDTFVAKFLLFDILAYSAVVGIPLLRLDDCAASISKCLAIIFAMIVSILHLLNIMGTAFRISLFDAWYNRPDLPPAVASHPRIVVLGLVNFIQLLLIFGTIYAIDPTKIIVPDGYTQDWLDPIYFSCIVQTTIGFGDRHPEGWLRGVAMLQSVCVFAFVVVFVTRAVGAMPQIRSIEEEERKSKGEKWPRGLTF